MMDPFCEQCLKEGQSTLVDDVHHILPLAEEEGMKKII